MMDSCSKTPEEREQFYAQVIARINQDDGYAAASHITITSMGEGCASGELEVKPDSLNPYGMVHGGCLATLADTVAGVAVHSSGMACVTLNCSMNYLRPAGGSKIYCEAAVQKAGRTIQVCEARLTNSQGECVASGTFTYYIVDPGIQRK